MPGVAAAFDSKWDGLTLADVQAFLDREHEEGLTWEAKGVEVRPEHVRKSGSGFANAIGGSLILGAERDDNAWRLPGVSFPGGEASTWLSNVIRELSPVPRYDVRVLPTEDGRLVAIVAFEAIDAPPCMDGGTVWVRVSGETVQVRDPAVLRSLFARGEGARERALELAQHAATAVYTRPLTTVDLPVLTRAEEGRPPTRSAFGLALAPIGWPAACRHRVLTKRFSESLLAIVSPGGERSLTGPATLDVSRACVQASVPSYYGLLVVRVYVQGAAAVSYGSARLGEHIQAAEVMQELGSAWKVAAEALEAAGATGDAVLALHLQTTHYPAGGKWTIHPTPKMDIARAASIGEPTQADLDSIRRELEREAGNIVWEPE
jgi:hypothetical protein